MVPNSVKKALRRGEVQLGCAFAQFRSPEIARILKTSGFDWAFVDTEHGNFSIETVQDICRVSALIGFCAVVRVAEMHYSQVARALDCGASGIVFPRVESAELLEHAVSWTKFPPDGVRGFGLTSMAVNYETASFPQMIEYFNENTLIILQIETVRAIEAREELLSVPGIDAVMIGTADLSISLGVPGEFDHPKMIEAMEAIRDTCVRRGVAPGAQTRSLGLARFWRERGMRFLGCSSETAMLADRAREITSNLR
jgi:2-dehydro-3-deoxyglucarate aldolase/4-hydroxy-2-oxoheptanedioate aldolase